MRRNTRWKRRTGAERRAYGPSQDPYLLVRRLEAKILPPRRSNGRKGIRRLRQYIAEYYPELAAQWASNGYRCKQR